MKKKSFGYTLVEMVVVIAVFGLLAGGVTISFMSSKKKQNAVLGQGQMVTMFRRLQGSALSARNLPDGKSASMYVLKIVSGTKPVVTVQAFDNTESAPVFYDKIEVLQIPADVTFDTMTVVRKDGVSIPARTCVQIGFLLPFSKIYIDDACSTNNGVGNGFGINQTIGNQNSLANTGDRVFKLPIRSSDGSYTKTLNVNGVSGLISIE